MEALGTHGSSEHLGLPWKGESPSWALSSSMEDLDFVDGGQDGGHIRLEVAIMHTCLAESPCRGVGLPIVMPVPFAVCPEAIEVHLQVKARVKVSFLGEVFKDILEAPFQRFPSTLLRVPGRPSTGTVKSKESEARYDFMHMVVLRRLISTVWATSPLVQELRRRHSQTLIMTLPCRLQSCPIHSWSHTSTPGKWSPKIRQKGGR